jgi:predicted metal-dependent hydrolase
VGRERKSRQLEVAGLKVTVPVRESTKAKRMGLVVGDTKSGDIELVVPRRTTEASIDDFIHRQRGWIFKQLSDYRAKSSMLGLKTPGLVWHLGEPIPLVRLPGSRPAARLGLRDGARSLGLSGPQSALPDVLERWVREEARLVLDVLCKREAPQLGVDYSRVRIGDQRSVWGSCSTTGTLSFTWRLLLCPWEVADYVCVHELCHRREMNHSKRFWDLVSSRRPDWRQQKAWLEAHGPEIRSWRPEDALGL